MDWITGDWSDGEQEQAGVEWTETGRCRNVLVVQARGSDLRSTTCQASNAIAAGRVPAVPLG